MSTEYQEKLKDGRWQRARLQRMESDYFACRDCGTNSNLQVHHAIYIRGWEPWDYPQNLLLTVCEKCHQFRQGREKAAQITLASEMLKWPPHQLEKAVWFWLEQFHKGSDEAIHGN